MGYRELIKKVQQYSGFSDVESKDALDNTIETLAIHLNEGERKDFASQLPEELQNIALAVFPTERTASQDIIQQVMEVQGIPEGRAKMQLLSAWRALKEAVTEGQLEHVLAQLPNNLVAMLRSAGATPAALR